MRLTLIALSFLFATNLHADDAVENASPSEDAAAAATTPAPEAALPPRLSEAREDEAVAARDHLIVIEWQLKKGKLDYDRIANILSAGDLAIVPAETSISVIAGLINHRLNENICVGWFREPSNARTPIGMIWRESQLAIVDTDGTVRPSCAAHPWGLRAKTSQMVTAQFLHRGTGRLIDFEGVALTKAMKAKDVVDLFRRVNQTGWPTLVVGEFKKPPKDESFKPAREAKFRALTKTQTDTIWYRNMALVESEPIRLNSRFPEVSAAYIRNNLGEGLPVRAEFALTESEDQLSTAPKLLSKKTMAPKPKLKVSAKSKIKVYPKQEAPQKISEDLAAEADQAEADDEAPAAHERQPDAVAKPKKKAKKKKEHASRGPKTKVSARSSQD